MNSLLHTFLHQFLYYSAILQSFQFIYTLRHNQQFSGNNNVKRLALFRVIETDKGYTMRVTVSLLYGSGEE